MKQFFSHVVLYIPVTLALGAALYRWRAAVKVAAQRISARLKDLEG